MSNQTFQPTDNRSDGVHFFLEIRSEAKAGFVRT